ncbi:carboxymuconolactone decarboxylase family protein [Caulobacter sp. BP25]|uniref:carboxymuconolactone decarboxylase family protein n=1 Tax=Caulobacter sp. BP25 TaxID=2048900 RepID=UPI000C12A514|nr:carboxymuconolactone decarboxylase family protein [Caulobacter sp. BP25]PHY18131.1 carboxymuconolactone decarboxylase [Caulobacter sp. BP25]
MTTPQDPTLALFNIVGSVSPVLVTYTQDKIVDELWSRLGLSRRDRAIVTVSTLVARNAQLAYPHYLEKALDSGLEPSELSELMTHLAFYAGWPNAFGAMATLSAIFAKRGVTTDQLPGVSEDLIPLEEAIPDEAIRASFIAETVTPVSPSLQHFTDDLLYHEVWRRPGLAPRDRGLATLSVLAASGQSDFLPFYFSRARQQGLTVEQFGEALSHIAFYGGWGAAIRAAGVLKTSLQGEG